jgi:uncharacterized protein YodC (DUF2158 family)
MVTHEVSADVKAGSVVWLKSGSPALMVTGMKRTDGVVMLEWFNGSELCRDAFDPENLTFRDPTVPLDRYIDPYGNVA